MLGSSHVVTDIFLWREVTETKSPIFLGFKNILIVFEIFYYAHAFKNNI